MRKPIQIAAFGVEHTERTQTNYFVVALCDDGTIWEYGDERGVWQKYDPIPQDEEKRKRDPNACFDCGSTGACECRGK